MVTKIETDHKDWETYYVRLPPGLRSKVKAVAALKGLSMQDYVAEILAKAVK